MRLARFSAGGDARIGYITDSGIVDVAARLADAPPSMLHLIDAWSSFEHRLAQLDGQPPDHKLGDVSLLCPIERPGKIMAIGLNYADHIAESGMPKPTAQTWFAKMSTAINGPFDPVELPRVSEQLDYEAELVAVIGRRCRHVAQERAHEVVFGYMAGNDVSVRDWQRRSPQFVIGKSFDTHAPVGPWIVTAEGIDPHVLPIRCLVNGDVRQQSNTCNLMFNVWDMVAELSQAMTLEPGDLIFTGTPGGVAAAMDPPLWLKVGDVVRVEVDGIGAIENRIAPEAP